MKIHEYQAKDLLKKYNVPVQEGIALNNLEYFDEVIKVLKEKGIKQYVVKSQIHAGGRGKGKVFSKSNRDELVVEGGVKFVGEDIKKGKDFASKLLGNVLVTHQTGSEGKEVQTIFITEGLDYKKELYLGILLDRTVYKNVIMAST
ncbi:MAG: ATP-grasp domain-containing protein, partial [Ignavibacteria bacterium]